MALSTSSNKVIHAGNGVATSFAFTFPILEASHLQVIHTDAGGNVITLAPSLYSATGIGSVNGGAVTYPLSGPALANGETLTILRVVPLTQTTVLSNQGGYYPEIVEGRFDRIYMALQQLSEEIGRATRDPPSMQRAGVVETLAALKGLTSRPASVLVKWGEGAGVWHWFAGDITPADEALIVECTSGPEGRYKRSYDGAVEAAWYGFSPASSAAANVAALQAALDTGLNVHISAASGVYEVDQQVEMTTPRQVLAGDGEQSKLKLVRGSGAEATPVIWIKPAALAAEVRNLAIDGNDTAYIAPTGGASIAFGDTVVVEASDAVVRDLYIENSWDNGVGIVRFLSGNAGQVNSYPERVQVTNIRGYNNGKGIGTGGGGGATVNNLGGSKVTVDTVTDYQSALAVTEDYAGGAGGTYSNITGQANTTGFIYAGSGDSVWSNLKSQNSAGFGIWIDGFASNVVVDGFDIKASAHAGVRLKGANHVLIANGLITNAGTGSSNVYPAVELDTSAGNMTGIYLHNIVVNHVLTATNSYGIAQTGGGTVSGEIVGGAYEGVSANFLSLSATIPYFNRTSTGFATKGVLATGRLDVTVAAAAEAMRVSGAAGKYFGVKPETAPNVAQIFYWTGVSFGTVELAGTSSFLSGATFLSHLKLAPFTVGTLPAAATVGAGARATVSNANGTTFMSTVAGGGSNIVPVVSDGTNWLIG